MTTINASNKKRDMQHDEEIDAKTDELIKVIEGYDDKDLSAHYICMKVVQAVASNDYEAYGILTDILIMYREATICHRAEKFNEA